MRSFKRLPLSLSLLAVQAFLAPAALAYENGGYLVAEVKSGKVAPPDLGDYSPVYPDLIGVTFPMSGDRAVMTALVPEYDPAKGPREYLKDRYKSSRFVFVYLPRTVYDYLYFIYYANEVYTDKNPKPSGGGMPKEAVETPDFAMYVAWSKGQQTALTDYFVAQAMAPAVLERHQAFNAWGLQWLMKKDGSLHNRLKEKEPGSVVRFDTDHLKRLVEDLTQKNKGTKPSNLNEVLKRVVEEENKDKNDRVTFLTRYTKDGPKGMNYPTIKDKASGDLTAHTFSMSFGSGIFAAAHGSDQHACTYVHLDKKDTFIMPVQIADYREGKGTEGVFFIPPYPAVLQQHMGLNELWHPRSRIFVVEGEATPTVEGIGDYTVYLFINNPYPEGPKDWKLVGFMLYDGGKPGKADAIKDYSRRVNDQIQKHGIIIVK